MSRAFALFVLVASAGCATPLTMKSYHEFDAGSSAAFRPKVIRLQTFARDRELWQNAHNTNFRPQYYVDVMNAVKSVLEEKGYEVQVLADKPFAYGNRVNTVFLESLKYPMAQAPDEAFLEVNSFAEAETRIVRSEYGTTEEVGHVTDSSGNRIATAYRDVTHQTEREKLVYFLDLHIALFYGTSLVPTYEREVSNKKGSSYRYRDVVAEALSGMPDRAGEGTRR